MKIAIGVRQSFGSPGLEVGRIAEFGRAAILPSDVRIEYYFGRMPTFGVLVSDSPRYLVPGRSATVNRSTVSETTDEQGASLEVLSYITSDVDEVTWAGATAGDSVAQDDIFALLETSREAVVHGIDYLAGALGLVLHRQLVLEPFTPDEFAVPLDRPGAPLCRQVGEVMEVLERGTINIRGVELSERVARHAAVMDQFPHWSAALFWLRRAWNEAGAGAKFIALFVALEMLLADVRTPEPADRRASRRAVLKLIKRERMGSVEWVQAALEPRRPTLDERFAAFAESAMLPGWELDARAIVAFNKMRNDTMHRGTTRATHIVSLDDGSVGDLEDIVERYLSYRMFGQAIVYPSRFRPAPA